MGMLWKIQKICSTMGTKNFEIDEEMSEIIDAKVGNPQNSTSKKWANFSQPWNLAFFQDYIFKKYVHFQSQRVPKWKIAHIWLIKISQHKQLKHWQLSFNAGTDTGLVMFKLTKVHWVSSIWYYVHIYPPDVPISDISYFHLSTEPTDGTLLYYWANNQHLKYIDTYN